MILWTLGLLFYFGATGSEFIYEWKGPAASTVKTWYLLGAAFVPAYLGMGTVYLLAPRRWAHSVMALLAAASVYLLVRMITASVDLAPLQGGVPLRSEDVLPASVRLSFAFTIPGSVALLGGALYSAWNFWRRKAPSHMVISNSLVALGAFFPLFGGSRARLASPDMLYLTEFIGVVVIYVGFLWSRESFALLVRRLFQRQPLSDRPHQP